MTHAPHELTRCMTCTTQYRRGIGCPVCSDPHARRRQKEKEDRRYGRD